MPVIPIAEKWLDCVAMASGTISFLNNATKADHI